jgi:hypothetical protein
MRLNCAQEAETREVRASTLPRVLRPTLGKGAVVRVRMSSESTLTHDRPVERCTGYNVTPHTYGVTVQYCTLVGKEGYQWAVSLRGRLARWISSIVPGPPFYRGVGALWRCGKKVAIVA